MADTPARMKLQKGMGSASSFLPCFWCWMSSVRLRTLTGADGPEGKLVMAGYSKPITPAFGMRTACQLITGRSDHRRLVTPEEQRIREAAAFQALSKGNASAVSALGCTGRCIFKEFLPYFDVQRCFLLASYHQLLLGMAKDFFAVLMGDVDEGTKIYAIPSNAKTRMAKLGRRIMLTDDCGRGFKELTRYKTFLIEDCMKWVELYSVVLFNEEVLGLPALRQEMIDGWTKFRKMYMMFLRPQTMGSDAFTDAGWEAASAAAEEYAQWAEVTLPKELLSLNLHHTVCQLARQASYVGAPYFYNELWVEGCMQMARSKSRKPKSSETAETTLANHLVLRMALETCSRQYGFKDLVDEEWPDPVGNIDINYNEPNVGSEGMLFGGRPLDEGAWPQIKEALLLTLRVRSNAPGWQRSWVSTADKASDLSAMVYPAAVIHKVVKISSVDYGKERTRSSCFVKVRYRTRFEDETSYAAVIQKLLLLKPPFGVEEREKNTLRVAICNIFNVTNPLLSFGESIICASISAGQSPFLRGNYAISLQNIDGKVMPLMNTNVELSRVNFGEGNIFFLSSHNLSGH